MVCTIFKYREIQASDVEAQNIHVDDDGNNDDDDDDDYGNVGGDDYDNADDDYSL